VNILLLFLLLYIYLTANGLTPGGSSAATLTHKQYTKYKEENLYRKEKIIEVRSAGRAPSLRDKPWHLPYN
jgi:hypothetical protein